MFRSARDSSVIWTRIFLGGLFVISGWLKSIDVYGCGLRSAAIADAFGLSGIEGMTQAACVVVSSFEILLGLCLVYRLWVRVTSMSALLLMLGFTVLTAAMAMLPDGAIETCGCFGELVSLPPLPTFLKNVVLLALAAWNCHVAWRAEGSPEAYGLRRLALCAMFALAVPLSSWLFLPAVDFLPYNRGTSIADNTADMIMGKENSMGELSVIDADSVLIHRGYTMILVANGKQTRRSVSSFKALADRCRKDNVNVVAVSSGSDVPIRAQHYLMDRTKLRQILRADNGAILLHEGRIIGKWNMLTMPFAAVKDITISVAMQSMIMPLFIISHVILLAMIMRGLTVRMSQDKILSHT